MSRSRPIAVKEVCQVNEEVPRAGLRSSQAEVGEPCCLSGEKPFFDVILSKSHVNSPHNMHIPSHAVPLLPRTLVPMVLTHGGKKWHTLFNGKVKRPRFEYSDWRSFVADNNLKCEDACIFEVMESSSRIVRLRVVILRNTNWLPPELRALHARNESRGKTAEAPIEIE